MPTYTHTHNAALPDPVRLQVCIRRASQAAQAQEAAIDRGDLQEACQMGAEVAFWRFWEHRERQASGQGSAGGGGAASGGGRADGGGWFSWLTGAGR